MSYSFWRPLTLAPGGACPLTPPSYATAPRHPRLTRGKFIIMRSVEPKGTICVCLYALNTFV